MTAFAAVIDALFADPNIGREAVYASEGGPPVLVRVVARRADAPLCQEKTHELQWISFG